MFLLERTTMSVRYKLAGILIGFTVLCIGCVMLRPIRPQDDPITSATQVPFVQMSHRIIRVPVEHRAMLNMRVDTYLDKNSHLVAEAIAAAEGVEMIEGVIVDLYGGISFDYVNLFGIAAKDWNLRSGGFMYYEKRKDTLFAKHMVVVFPVTDFAYTYDRFGFSFDSFDESNGSVSDDWKTYTHVSNDRSFKFYESISIVGDNATIRNSRCVDPDNYIIFSKQTETDYSIGGESYIAEYGEPTAMQIVNGVLHIQTSITVFGLFGEPEIKRCDFTVRRSNRSIEAKDEKSGKFFRVVYDAERNNLVIYDDLRSFNCRQVSLELLD